MVIFIFLKSHILHYFTSFTILLLHLSLFWLRPYLPLPGWREAHLLSIFLMLYIYFQCNSHINHETTYYISHAVDWYNYISPLFDIYNITSLQHLSLFLSYCPLGCTTWTRSIWLYLPIHVFLLILHSTLVYGAYLPFLVFLAGSKRWLSKPT